jgi:hypothetical protein
MQITYSHMRKVYARALWTCLLHALMILFPSERQGLVWSFVKYMWLYASCFDKYLFHYLHLLIYRSYWLIWSKYSTLSTCEGFSSWNILFLLFHCALIFMTQILLVFFLLCSCFIIDDWKPHYFAACFMWPVIINEETKFPVFPWSVFCCTQSVLAIRKLLQKYRNTSLMHGVQCHVRLETLGKYIHFSPMIFS